MDTINVVKWMLYLMSLISLGVSKHGSRECPYEPYDPQDTHPLINLGNSLKHRLSILNQPCPYGRLIFKDLVKYYNRLSDVYRLLKRRDIVDIVKMYKVYAEVNKTGGPPHLNIMMDYEGLQKTYDWRDKEEVKAIKQVMLLTKELWEDIEDRVTHLRSGQPEPTPVEESTIDWTPFIREVSSGSDASHY